MHQKTGSSFSPKKNDIRDIVSDFLATHKQNPLSTNYKHHNFPTHSILKSKEKSKGIFIHKLAQPIKQLQLGRNIFSTGKLNKNSPGPGSYEFNSTVKNNWGYIAKEPQQIVHKNSQVKKKMMVTVGPGFYKHESKQSQLSNHKKITGTVFAPKKVPRFVYKQLNNNPGPGDYNPLYSIQKSSSHSNLQCYSISNTHRSSIIKKEKVPGPGQYQWQKFYKKGKDPQQKPAIQFKFVYGHPS